MLSLDEHRKTDKVFEIDGFLFVVDKNFFNQYQPIKVDYNYTGYKISAAVNYGKSYFSRTMAPDDSDKTTNGQQT
jgi:Fe-S cluster assembly iron-binding protein IscA